MSARGPSSPRARNPGRAAAAGGAIVHDMCRERSPGDEATSDTRSTGRSAFAVSQSRLGRVVRATADRPAIPHREQHRRTNWLRDVILGGQDGLVNILGIILGVIAADGSTTILLVTGIAAAITESISMGAVGYTSSVAERDYYEAARRREQAEMEATPEIERREIRDIYAAKGFSGDL